MFGCAVSEPKTNRTNDRKQTPHATNKWKHQALSQRLGLRNTRRSLNANGSPDLQCGGVVTALAKSPTGVTAMAFKLQYTCIYIYNIMVGRFLTLPRQPWAAGHSAHQPQLPNSSKQERRNKRKKLEQKRKGTHNRKKTTGNNMQK